MADIRIIPTRAQHIRRVAAVMRQADRDEVDAITGRSPLWALVHSYGRSSMCMTVLIDGEAEMIFGAGDVSILTGVGAPWLLGSDKAVSHRLEFLRGSVRWRDQLLQRYSVLRNIVDCRNRVAVRWLKWLGFTFSEPFHYRGHDLMAFELRAENVR